MDHIEDIIKRRSLPGILIFSREGELVFINGETRAMLDALCGGKGATHGLRVPDEIKYLSKRALEEKSGGGGEKEPLHLLFPAHGALYMARAVPLFRSSSDRPSHTMVIIEKCATRVNIDPDRVRKRFSLTPREVEVVGELLKGRTNTEAARHLSISEHTVKDHIKKIMMKLGVNSRALIVCRILE